MPRAETEVPKVTVKTTTTEPCQICDFLEKGYGLAHSKQARADYSGAYVDHRLTIHLNQDARTK